MVELPRLPETDAQDEDQRVVIHGVTWQQYETLRDALDDIPGLHLTYLEGALEIMSPSRRHEHIKKLLARLIEIHALERDLHLNGYGSTTFHRAARERGLEPDECYCLGELKEVPDIALEVVLSRGLVDKLAVYAGLEVPEVWLWKDERLLVFRLGPDGYTPRERSEVLPDLDPGALANFVKLPDQTDAVRAYRDHLRGGK